MDRFPFLLLAISSFLLSTLVFSSNPSDLFFCVDWDCQDFISRGRTLQNHKGATEKHLSFKQNEDIKILSKPVDEENGPEWVGMIQRRIGLVPKSIIQEEQMGKRVSTFKYPMNLLPLWSQPVGGIEEPPEEKEESDYSADDNVEEVDDEVQHNSTPADVTESPPPSQVTSEGTIMPDNYDEAAQQSVDSGGDVADPPQTTVVPDELQKQENVEPTETVDHEIPEIPIATSVGEGQGEGNADFTEVIIEPTKSSTLDQLMTTATEVVVEPSEIVDLKDPQDILESPQVTLEPIPDVKEEEATTAKPDSDSSAQGVTESAPEVTTEKPPEEATTQSSSTPEVEIPKDEPAPVATETEESKKEDVSGQNESVADEWESSTASPEEEDTVEDEYEEGDDDEADESEEPSVTEESQSVETSTASPVENVESEASKIESQLADNTQEQKTESTDTEKQNEDHSHPQDTTEALTQENVVEEQQQALDPVISTEAPQETSTPIPSDEPVTTETPPEEVTQAPEPAAEEPTPSPVDDELSTVAPEINPDEPPADVGTFASWFQETAQLTDHDQLKESTQENPTESTEKPVGSETQPPIYEEVTSTTEAPYQPEYTEAPYEPQVISEETSTEAPVEYIPSTETVPATPEVKPETVSTEPEHDQSHTHDHDHGHDHHHHHHHHEPKQSDADSSSFIVIVKHLSSILLSFLPEHLQDTILDVDDALVFTGIIALTLVSICVPYFLIEGFFAVRPLKKKVNELNKSLWKVSTAYENQQEEFEIYKKKALAYDEDKKRVDQLEYELGILKKLEGKHKEEVTRLRQELKTNARLADDVQAMIETTMERKNKAVEEKDKLKTTVTSLKEALRRTTDELQEAQAEGSSAVMDLELARQSNETYTMKVDILEREVGELKGKLVAEVERRRNAEDERDEASKSKTTIENELTELKKICHKYEDTVSDLNTEISHKENELAALKETLGDDSPLVDIAEVKAKLVNAEEEATSLQSRVEAMTLENSSLSRSLKEATSSLSTIQKDRDEAFNRLQVLEAWFKEKEEELRKAVERYEAEKNIRGKDKDDLVRMIEEKSDENKQLNDRLEAFKEEFEETKQQQRNEIRALEAKSHENWLSLCQAERKAQDARKEAEFLRQKLTVLTKEKDGDGEELNGEVPMYPLITPDMVPLPLPDDGPSYFGLGEGFMPPPPLPLDDEREPHRPAPLGRLSPTSYSDIDDSMLSPIRRGRDDDYSDGESSGSDSPRRRRSPRGGWVDVQHDRDRNRNRDRDRERDERHRRAQGPRTSSPIPHQGFNL